MRFYDPSQSPAVPGSFVSELEKTASAEGSGSSVETSEEVTSSTQNIPTKAMLSVREMEYQFWENYPSLDNISEEGKLADHSFFNFLANSLMMHRRLKHEFIRRHHRLLEQLLAQAETNEPPRHVTLRPGDGSELLHTGDLLRLRNGVEAAGIR